MERKEMLNVIVDLANGIYIISRNNGKEVVTKSINENGKRSYDPKQMKQRRKEINAKKVYVASDKEKAIDPTLYEALEEFDNIYGSEYRTVYRDTTLESIPFNCNSEKNSARKRREKEIKAKELEKAGISIEYKINLFKWPKGLSLFDRIRAVKLAFSQRLNGIKIRMDKSQEALLEETIKKETVEGDFEAEPKEEIKIDVQAIKENDSQADSRVVIEKEAEPIIQTSEEQTPIPEEKKKERKKSGKKKTLSRAKTIQASKKLKRENAKMRNLYQEKIKAKEAKRIAAEKRRQEAEKRRQEEAEKIKQEEIRKIEQQKIKQEQEKMAREEKAEGIKKESRIIITPGIRKILQRANITQNGGRILNKFTRKKKNPDDKIENKTPAKKVSKKVLLGTAAGAVCVIAASTLLLQLDLQKNSENVTENELPSQSTETMTTPSVDLKYEIKTPEDGKATIIINSEDAEQTKHEEQQSEEAQRKEYLSSVRVGAKMNIQEGRYYECPNGTGNYGNFKNFQNGDKEITIIGVETNEGYIEVTDSSVSLYDLKQQYPKDAKFSYHFVSRNKDGSTTILGWLTENSMQNEIQIEDLER